MVQRGLGQTRFGEHFVAVGFVQLGDLGFQLRTDADDGCPHLGRMLADTLHQGIGSLQVRFVDVGDVQNRFGGHQPVTPDRDRFGFRQL